MALPLSDSLLSLSFTFEKVDTGNVYELTIADLIAALYNTTYGYTLSQIKGILKVTDPNGNVIHQHDGWATDDFTTPDIDGNTLDWSVASIAMTLEDNEIDMLAGTYTIGYKISVDGGTSVGFSFTERTVEIDYVGPIVSISMSTSCRTSELTSTDNTVYDVTSGGATLSPNSTVRAHVITIPVGSGFTPIPGSSTDASRTIGGGAESATRLWTRVWITTITTTLNYTLVDGDSQNFYVYVDEIAAGFDSLDVDCDNCGCDMRTCIQNMVTLWKDAIANKGANRINELHDKVLKLVSAWMNYRLARECGDNADQDTYCQEISEIVSSEDAECSHTADTKSAVVVPWEEASGSGGSSCCVWSYGSGEPVGGSAGDFYIRTNGTTVWNLWTNIAGTWTDLGSFRGATGPTGTIGPSGAVETGPTGPQGTMGTMVTGSQGQTGDKGDTGNIVTGDTGTKGDDGDTGTKGDDGDTGIGITGTKGDDGDTGDQGDTGLSVKGDTGAEFVTETAGTSPTGDSETPSGIGNIFVDTTNKLIWMSVGTGGTDWVLITN